MADFTKVGYATKRQIVYKHESHKLHQAFEVVDGEKIRVGNVVCLDEDGKIYVFDPANPRRKDKMDALLVIGYAVTDNINPAYLETGTRGPVEVTVAMRGYSLLRVLSADGFDAGPVEPQGNMDSDDHYSYWAEADLTDLPRYWGIALNPASGKDEEVQVLIL